MQVVCSITYFVTTRVRYTCTSTALHATTKNSTLPVTLYLRQRLSRLERRNTFFKPLASHVATPIPNEDIRFSGAAMSQSKITSLMGSSFFPPKLEIWATNPSAGRVTWSVEGLNRLIMEWLVTLYRNRVPD